MTTRFENPVFCALDTTDVSRAVALGQALKGRVGGLKIGMEFFYAAGPEGYAKVAEIGLPIFLDLKLHDIPNTVAGGIRAVLPLKPAIVNVHASGGAAMMRAAAEAAADAGETRPLVIGVTILTSLNMDDLTEAGYRQTADGTTAERVLTLARNAHGAGLDGVVCSAQELGVIRKELPREFLTIVPGIRPEGAAAGDQKRVMTPKLALEAGADILVIGRPITAADDPAAAADAILQEITPEAA